jgi:O-antigen ligase
MELTDTQYVQLILGLLAGALVFLGGYVFSPGFTIPVLFLLVPFQYVESRFGTGNVVLTFLLGAALFLKGYVRELPMAGWVLAIVLAYLASFSQVTPAAYVEHAPYLLVLGANFILFYLVYSYVRALPDALAAGRLLVALNAIVVLYCYVQLLMGFEQLTFGTPELGLQQNRLDQRLSGPFYAVGLTAEYLVLSVFICAYELLNARRGGYKLLLVCLIAANFAFLVATGNRGGILSLLGGCILFLYLFRKELGPTRILGFVSVGVLLFSLMSALVIHYTDFNRLYERLAATEIDGVVPDTRQQTWQSALEAIPQRPLLGHGPRLRLYADDRRDIPGHTPIPYPHSLYLYLLYTVGVVGLVAFMGFFVSVFLRLRRAARAPEHDVYLSGWCKLGQLLVVVFLVDQLKLEFLRFALSDYQQYLFALLAILVALSDRVLSKSPREVAPVRISQRPRRNMAEVALMDGGQRQTQPGDERPLPEIGR